MIVGMDLKVYFIFSECQFVGTTFWPVCLMETLHENLHTWEEITACLPASLLLVLLT